MEFLERWSMLEFIAGVKLVFSAGIYLYSEHIPFDSVLPTHHNLQLAIHNSLTS